jgi:hypothetical protein
VVGGLVLAVIGTIVLVAWFVATLVGTVLNALS